MKNIRREILSKENQESWWIAETLATQEKDQLKRQRKPTKGSKKQKHRRARDRSRSSSSSQSSHSYKAEYPGEAGEREESTTGFDKSKSGTKDFVSPNEKRRQSSGTLEFRGRGRGWGRGNYSGYNNHSNNDFQKRRWEEWDPEYTPKSKKYYLPDNREGEGSDKWMSGGHG